MSLKKRCRNLGLSLLVDRNEAGEPCCIAIEAPRGHHFSSGLRELVCFYDEDGTEAMDRLNNETPVSPCIPECEWWGKSPEDTLENALAIIRDSMPIIERLKKSVAIGLLWECPPAQRQTHFTKEP